MPFQAMILFYLILVLGFAWYVMTPQQRQYVGGGLLGVVQRLTHVAVSSRTAGEPFRDVLRMRTRWALTTPALLALNTMVFILMVWGPGRVGDAETLVAWGASYGPRTTNGEWWRLLTATFIHSGMLHLFVNMAAFVQLGVLLERLVGPLALTATYLAAGIFADIVTLSAHPVAVTSGSSGAIFGVYGLLLAVLVWTVLQRSPLTIPFAVIRSLAPTTLVFAFYNLATGSLENGADVVGLATGFACGLVVAKDVGESKPPVRRVAMAAAASIVIAAVYAVPLRGLADVRPELARVTALEHRIANVYETALLRFRNGRISAEALAQLIDRTIMPELEAARMRLEALNGVPHEHQRMVASAEEYLRLRDESWRLRAEGLRTTNMRALRAADQTERASLEALQKIGPVNQ